ncbi:hypothetical protein DFJ58DRAFT_668137, partial [Suillus subalutaceus]|uniref:uncharacterized protein n=1 Tax=Suillus subalutaceus TaxID=48586 RepID=UPI001B884F38
VAADYNCRLSADTPPMRVFLLTFFGLFIRICFIKSLGAALMTITDPAHIVVFADGSTGAQSRKFSLLGVALTNSTNNIVNTYSAGLSIQALGCPFAVILRFFWIFLAFVCSRGCRQTLHPLLRH